MPTLSVIIPVYNTERFLARVIESVLAQTFTDFELILVDDGSTDASGEICDRYAGADKRVRVIHSSNHGASAARNRGIEEATGLWLTFIDSDDYVLPEYLGNMFDSGSKYNSDLVMTGLQRISENDPSKNVVRDWPELAVDKDHIEELYNQNILQYQKGPVIKLYKNEIIKKNKVRFDENLSRGEDALFVYSYLPYSQRMSVAPGANYIYCLRDGSLMSQLSARFEVELYGYERMKAQLMPLTSMKHPYPKQFLIYWFDRVINSLYSLSKGYTREERIKLLGELDYGIYKKWKEPVSWRDGIKKKLLCSRCFKLYDLITGAGMPQ